MKLKYILSLGFISFNLFSSEPSDELVSELGDELVNVAKEGNLEEVSKLLDSGADINYLKGGSRTALMKAAHNNHPKLVLFLLKKGAKVDISNEETFEEALKLSVDQAKYDKLTSDEYNSYLDIIKNLLKFGANPNLKSKESGYGRAQNALQVAAHVDYGGDKKRCLELVKILLQSGANPRYISKEYNSQQQQTHKVDKLIDSDSKEISLVLKEASKLKKLLYHSLKTNEILTTPSRNLLTKINSFKIDDWQFGFLFNTLVEDIKNNGINDFKRVVLLTLLKRIHKQNPDIKVALGIVVLSGLRKALDKPEFEEVIPFWLARNLDVQIRMKSGTALENIASLILSTK